MAAEYIEVNSAYRDRNQFPFSSDFIVPISQSGMKTASTAVDPVSIAAPINVFTPFAALTGFYAPPASNLSSSSAQMSVILGIPSGQQASKTTNYYAGSVVRIATAPAQYYNIKSWRYMETTGGLDFFDVDFYGFISQGVPYNTAITISDSTSLADPANPNIYIPASPTADNYNINQIIYNQTRNQWLPIKAYDGFTHIASLNTTSGLGIYVPGTWLLTDTYVLRGAAPIQAGNNLVGITPVTAQIVPISASDPDGSYVGNFIRVLSSGEMRRIISYTRATQIAGFAKPFSAIPAGQYEMLQFTRDNQGYLQFNNTSEAIREAVCYDVTLMNIVLPNSILTVSQGSRAIYYPYVYVEFRSLKNSDRQGSNSIISNNPNATRMLFRALLSDTTNMEVSPFIRLDGNGMVQRIKLDPLGSYHCAVHLPDGSLFLTSVPEFYSPLPPNPLSQISAMFSFKRVSQ